MAVITKNEIKISNKYVSVRNLSEQIYLKLTQFSRFAKNLVIDSIRLVFSQKREPTSLESRKAYLDHQNRVNSISTSNFRVLR